MILVGHVLDHVLDHIIIGLVTTALQEISEPVLIHLFCNSLRLFIRDQASRQKGVLGQAIWKTIISEAKAAFIFLF